MRDDKSLVPATPGCAGCADRARRIAELEALVAKLAKRIQALEERLGQNSRNSSRPPSSDPPGTKARPPKPPTGRRPGGQPEHEGKNRGLLPIEKVDRLNHHYPETCEKCGQSLPQRPGPDDPPALRHQTWELQDKPVQVTEDQYHSTGCSCGHATRAPIPKHLSGFGPRLAAMAAFLTGACHLSRRLVEEVFEDVLMVPIALGTVSNLEAEVSDALAPPYQEAATAVQEAPAKNLDETGWKQRGKRHWLWAAATATIAFFSIHRLRGEEGLLKLLGGKLLGIFSTDRWSAYRSRVNRLRQICWAHLLRDFQKLIDRGGREGKLGEKAKDLASWIFPAWEDFQTGDIDRETLKRCLRSLRWEFKLVLEEGVRLRGTKAAIFCQNLLDLEPALWTFLREEGVEPTNNHAERVLRRGVLWRKNSFGSASDRGSRFVERMLTVVQSLRLQKRPVFEYLAQAVEAHRHGGQAPSILPA